MPKTAVVEALTDDLTGSLKIPEQYAACPPECTYMKAAVSQQQKGDPNAVTLYLCPDCKICMMHCNCKTAEACGCKVAKLEGPDYCEQCGSCAECCSGEWCKTCNVFENHPPDVEELEEEPAQSTVLPWHKRGVDLKLKAKDFGLWDPKAQKMVVGPYASQQEVAVKTWEIDDTINPVVEMADFYLLEGIANRLIFGADRINEAMGIAKLDSVCEEARNMRAEQITRLDRNFRAYVDMACGGELRYHTAMALAGVGKSNNNRGGAWLYWRKLREIGGSELLLEAAAMFREMKEASIGGERWAVACELLHQRETGEMPDWLWVDRVFTLQHNGGTFLNKIHWGMPHTRRNLPHGVEPCKQIGDAHAANPTRWNELLLMASPPVRRLWEEAHVAARIMPGHPFEGLWLFCGRLCIGHETSKYGITPAGPLLTPDQRRSEFLRRGGPPEFAEHATKLIGANRFLQLSDPFTTEQIDVMARELFFDGLVTEEEMLPHSPYKQKEKAQKEAMKKKTTPSSPYSVATLAATNGPIDVNYTQVKPVGAAVVDNKELF